MRAFENAELVRGLTGPYDITPGWNPLVGSLSGNYGFFLTFRASL